MNDSDDVLSEIKESERMNRAIDKNIRVEILSGQKVDYLQSSINKFLAKHDVKSIKFLMNNNVLVAIIQYYIKDDENIEKSLF